MIFRFVTGPTGSGKTSFAYEIAEKFTRTLVNTDPFQFYREIPILSNQPQNPKVPTKFLANYSLNEPMSAGAFSRLSKPLIDSDVLWVGTGLYLGAALYGLDEDRRKGTPFQTEPRVDFCGIVLNPPRDVLYQQLNDRVDAMLKQGALQEAERVLKLISTQTVNESNPVLKAIGLKHLICFLRGEWSEEEAIRLWKRDTRRLAKRQWTWLRKFCPPSEKILWLETADISTAIQFLGY